MLEDGKGARCGAELMRAGSRRFSRRRERPQFRHSSARPGRLDRSRTEIKTTTHGSPHLKPQAVAKRRRVRCCTNGSKSTMIVSATIVPEIGRVKKTVQSFEKLIMVFIKASSAMGPRITPSTSGAIGNFNRSKP